MWTVKTSKFSFQIMKLSIPFSCSTIRFFTPVSLSLSFTRSRVNFTHTLSLSLSLYLSLSHTHTHTHMLTYTHSFYVHFQVLASKHKVWVDYWIYWVLIKCNFKFLQPFRCYALSTNKYRTLQSTSVCYVFTSRCLVAASNIINLFASLLTAKGWSPTATADSRLTIYCPEQSTQEQ
jgi:hypothetical protein